MLLSAEEVEEEKKAERLVAEDCLRQRSATDVLLALPLRSSCRTSSEGTEEAETSVPEELPFLCAG